MKELDEEEVPVVSEEKEGIDNLNEDTGEEIDEDIDEDINVDELLKEEETFYFRNKPMSGFRRRAGEILKNVDFVNDRRLAVVNVESGKVYRFDSVLEVQDFIKERAGKWYVTTPGPLNFANIKEAQRKSKKCSSQESIR